MDISNEVISILDDLCKKFGIAIDWTAQNILPYLETLCKKFITFEIQTSIFWIAFMGITCAICWIITAILSRKASKLKWDSYKYTVTVAMGAIVVSAVWSLISLIVIGVQIYDIVETTTFPEKTLYDYIAYYLDGAD